MRTRLIICDGRILTPSEYAAYDASIRLRAFNKPIPPRHPRVESKRIPIKARLACSTF